MLPKPIKRRSCSWEFCIYPPEGGALHSRQHACKCCGVSDHPEPERMSRKVQRAASPSSHRQRQEAVWALEERVRQLQRDLGDTQAEARALREQLSSFTELVKAAWQGECVAVAEVSRIVGVVPPLISVPAKEGGQPHMRILNAAFR
ncbi:hypothetical protein AALO_G00176800 [Alosa alosa]|uniref:Uncharacterized protein n=1 Tax=Alosa alosa TaxID=278164 RepID=A0AAV6G9B7_9TELE|nr:hypothetical protein AALO_G00176800 [Alosa alosa]